MFWACPPTGSERSLDDCLMRSSIFFGFGIHWQCNLKVDDYTRARDGGESKDTEGELA
jgi:hypothetical protein